MNLRALLFTLMALLAGAAIAPWLYGTAGADPQTPPDHRAAPAPLDFNDPGPLESYVAILERPVFLASRRPAAPHKNPRGQPGEVLLLDRYPVVGVVVAGDTRMVLIRQEPDGSIRRIALGAVLDGWTLSGVTRERLVLEMAGNRKEVLLKRNGGEAP